MKVTHCSGSQGYISKLNCVNIRSRILFNKTYYTDVVSWFCYCFGKSQRSYWNSDCIFNKRNLGQPDQLVPLVWLRPPLNCLVSCVGEGAEVQNYQQGNTIKLNWNVFLLLIKTALNVTKYKKNSSLPGWELLRSVDVCQVFDSILFFFCMTS